MRPRYRSGTAGFCSGYWTVTGLLNIFRSVTPIPVSISRITSLPPRRLSLPAPRRRPPSSPSRFHLRGRRRRHPSRSALSGGAGPMHVAWHQKNPGGYGAHRSHGELGGLPFHLDPDRSVCAQALGVGGRDPRDRRAGHLAHRGRAAREDLTAERAVHAKYRETISGGDRSERRRRFDLQHGDVQRAAVIAGRDVADRLPEGMASRERASQLGERARGGLADRVLAQELERPPGGPGGRVGRGETRSARKGLVMDQIAHRAAGDTSRGEGLGASRAVDEHAVRLIRSSRGQEHGSRASERAREIVEPAAPSSDAPPAADTRSEINDSSVLSRPGWIGITRSATSPR